MFEKSLWIWQGAGEPDEYADFRLKFLAEKGKNYQLYICCDTDYALYNGDKLIAFGQYSDYPETRVYDTIDLSNFVVSGENNLKLTVWHQGKNNFTYVAKAAGVIFTITEDGKPILCSSNETKGRISPCTAQMHFYNHSTRFDLFIHCRSGRNRVYKQYGCKRFAQTRYAKTRKETYHIRADRVEIGRNGSV